MSAILHLEWIFVQGPGHAPFHRFVFFKPSPLKRWDRFKPCSPAVFFGRDLFGCLRHIYRHIMKCLNATYNIFLQNCLNTSNYPKHMFLPFFSETFGQFSTISNGCFGCIWREWFSPLRLVEVPKLCDYLGPFEAMNSQQSRGVFCLVWCGEFIPMLMRLI